MAHYYGSVTELKKHLVDGGTGYGTTNDDELLQILQSVSASIDHYCRRTEPDHVTSGFGPRIGTNRYDADGGSCLRLGDDLLSVTTFTVLDGTAAGTSQSPVVDTDYYLKPYDRAPYREVILHGQGISAFPRGIRTISIAGTWGYSNETVTSTTTVASGLASGTTATTFTTSATPTIEIGQALLIESEQVTLTGLNGTTATVVRGVNGTTAATHANSSAIAVYRYPRDVMRCTLALAARRRRMRDANVGGEMGGGEMPAFTFSASEKSIARDYLWAFKLIEMV